MNRHPSSDVAHSPIRRVGVAVLTAVVALGMALATGAAEEKPKKKVAHIPGSRFTYVHRLGLKDFEGNNVSLDEPPALPFSYRHTCSKCHEYEVVQKGWHFNAADPAVPPGRPGQPWFWADQTTATQIPVSYRDWPNTWRPGEVGLKPWQFIQTFGHHLNGGGPGEMTTVEDKAARWLVSGTLEINCGSCHSGDPAYDQVENFLQIARQNFRWAATAASPIADVTGIAAAMPAFYDPVMPPENEKIAKQAPDVSYNKATFDDLGRVFFDLPSQPPNKRCYFCHSYTQVGDGAPEVWKTDDDVHMLSGLTCTDCHRHGLEHTVSRNYEGEALAKGDPQLSTLTCRGCHLGDESAEAGPHTMGSRLGAPVPTHIGLPSIHLEKLACTTCHSGPYPATRTTRVQTSRAHSLEFQGAHRGRHALPYIVEPVFAHRDYDGTIGPQRMVWPAFWARIDTEDLKPMAPTEVFGMAKDAFQASYEAEPVAETPEAPPEKAPADDAKAEADSDDAETPAEKTDEPAQPIAEAKTVAEDELEGLTAPKPDFPPAKVKAILAALAKKEDGTAFGYVCSGKLHTLADSGDLVATDHRRAQPAAWPIAHNVRPAEYALGAKPGNAACTECHGFDAFAAFGEVEVASPVDLGDEAMLPMYTFQGRDPTVQWAWGMSYIFRPYFKIVGFATAALIAAILAAYLIRGLVGLARWAASKAPTGPAS